MNVPRLRQVARWARCGPLEAAFWIGALAVVASFNPQGDGLNLCLLETIGLPCPGDGLGRAIAFLARGQFAASWAMHPLAGPSVGILLGHVAQLCRQAPWPPAARSTPPSEQLASSS